MKSDFSWCVELKKQFNCAVCGTPNKEGATLHFHHIDPSTKVAEVGKMIRSNSYTTKAVLEEVKKCIPVCDPCHGMIHQGALSGWLRTRFGDASKAEQVRVAKIIPAVLEVSKSLGKSF